MTQAPALDRDVMCPLCDYNLRGLVEPRCPECGHQFDWTDLLDRTWEHPWLFEHGRKRRIQALFRTFFASLLPWRFWRSVRPTHTPKPLWLFIYWLCCVAPAIVALGSFLLQLILERTGTRIRDPDLAEFLGFIFDRLPPVVVAPLALMYLCWPGATMLVLMIFRQTMRQARIKPDHVVRCVVYSCDALIVMVIPLVVLCTADSVWGYNYYRSYSAWASLGPLLLPPIVGFLSVALLVLIWRLATAYRMYLGFPNAILTCVLSQVVVGLFYFTVYMVWAVRGLK